jgi:prefoldin subunit 5
MTTPSPEQLAAMIPPNTRLYVEGVARGATMELADRLHKAVASLDDRLTEIERLLQNLNGRVTLLERRYQEDDKFALTKARIARFIEEHDLK